jgi:hypothetical protein
MLKQLIVIDYQEGAGGEFIASWLSAHFGQQLEINTQDNPNYLQKWLNSHSLITPDWQINFTEYLLNFNNLCSEHNIQHICIPYHLYKWPEHVDILKKINQARFIRINCEGYEFQIAEDFKRKILDRVLGPKDFAEIKFMLGNQDKEKRKHCLNLFKQGKLTYNELVPTTSSIESKHLPSADLEIMYGDLFVDFTGTLAAYKQLCNQLEISPDLVLLDALVDRNRKNLQHHQKHLSTA